MRLTLIVNILDLLALLSPTALRFLEIQGIPGSLAWCDNLATRAPGRIVRVHVLDNDYHEIRRRLSPSVLHKYQGRHTNPEQLSDFFGNDSVRPNLRKRSKFSDCTVLISKLPINKTLRSLLR